MKNCTERKFEQVQRNKMRRSQFRKLMFLLNIFEDGRGPENIGANAVK